ncbi:MAG: sigma-70 family RNA polymerase sigma factor [Candidatus Krumholzibacteriota bacterium]|nr:sigma-70 family RNA polymerase sigma factor [Candidatus Krumholzibacteriota bacterium]
MDEKTLVIRAKGGDRAAFDELASAWVDRIYRLGLKLTGDEDEAQDILQETFLKAVDNIDRFRMESSFGTWLYAIALNAVRAAAGTRKRMQLKPIEEYVPGDGHDDPRLFDWGDPHRLYEERELRRLVDEALAAIPEEHAMPFVLRYVEGLPVKEIAEVMGLTPAATKSRILRTRLALRERLGERFREKIDETL